MGSSTSSYFSGTPRQHTNRKKTTTSARISSSTPSPSPQPLTRRTNTAASSHGSNTSELFPRNAERGMEHVAARPGRGRMNVVDLHSVCGYTSDGVPAYSNGSSNTWTNSKSYIDGVFMGYRWQCVEFARRWLWSTQRLLLPERNCAYCFASCKFIYRLKDDLMDLRRQSEHHAAEESAAQPRISPPIAHNPTTTSTSVGVFASPSSSGTDGASSTSTTPTLEVLGPRKDAAAWEKVPAVFVKQGSLAPPVPKSLIVYPMSWGSPWGHIGVVTQVDVARGLVYVADQNRYFHHWGRRGYSAVFPLEVDRGRYYIRDHESECKGWLTFPSYVEGH